jgi:phage terminase large subunit
MICELKNFNDPFYWNIQAIKDGNNLILHQGGTSSSKTWSNLQFIVLWSLKYPNELTSVVSETMPHLKRGAMKDFINILNNAGLYSEKIHNKSEHKFKIGKSIVEFFSADQSDKLRGPRRNNLFINECNNITFDSFEQLNIRTSGWTILDYNPTSEFYVHSDLINLPKSKFFKSTYKNNKFLPAKIIEAIEAKRNNPKYANWWRVYGEGEVGSNEGLIYPKIHIIDSMPEGITKFYGLDFGYTNDPTALIEVCKKDNALYLNEVIYETQLLNRDIIARMKQHDIKGNMIVADSAEPKTIAEIYGAGFNIHPAEKGKDSINAGIQLINEFDIYVTKDSLNLIKEFRNYQYVKDKNGKTLNVPCDYYNHGLDAVRYLVLKQFSKKYIFSGHKLAKC